MKGAQKEVQAFFGSNVQTYIVASRVAQRYEEKLQSSDAEKHDVIVQWKLLRRYFNYKRNPDDMVQDGLEALRKKDIEDTVTRQNGGPSSSNSTDSAGVDAPTRNAETWTVTLGGSRVSEGSLNAAGVNETNRLSVSEWSQRDVKEGANKERNILENEPQLQRQQQEARDHRTAEQEPLRRAIAASETEAQRQASDALGFQKQLERVMAESVSEQRQLGSDNELESDIGLDDEDEDEDDRATRTPDGTEEMAVAAVVAGGARSVQRRDRSYESGAS